MNELNSHDTMLRIHGDVNDTRTPGFSMDYFLLELSCDSRGLFTSFYLKEKLYNKDVKEASGALAEQSGGVSRQVA